MKQIREKIWQNKPQSIADFFRLHQEIRDEVAVRQVEGGKKVKIAILTSFTSKGFVESLLVKCCADGIFPEIYTGDYNQYNQEILDDQSGLYEFSPDLIFIFIDSRTFFGEYFFFPYDISDADRRIMTKEKIEVLASLVAKIKSRSTAKVILHNFEVPYYSPLGIAENKQGFGLVESVEAINSNLREKYKPDSQVFIFDYNSFCSCIGKNNLMDQKMYYLADLKLDLRHIPKLCDWYLSYIKPAVSIIKKCIVLDLDNTLWGGVIGEDGVEGIRIGPTTSGRSFWEFQKYLLSLYKRGIILAVNSKNNFEDAIKVFRDHPEMILREKHFALMKINWNDKASNLKLIAEELNIGIDTLVFIDDEKMNRDLVMQTLPQVQVVDLPVDSSLYSQTLADLNDFNVFQITEEDKKKGQMYVEQRSREELKTKVNDITEYLRCLNMEVELEEMNNYNLPRLAQLAQKTNQFNMTTRRYTEDDFARFKERGDLVISVRVKDKFGDNGIVGLVVLERNNETGWRVDGFLLSCRVIGRKIEDVILNYVVGRAKEVGCASLLAEFIETKKNIPARDFYKNFGFVRVSDKDGIENWEFNLDNPVTAPDYIKLIIK